MKHIENVYARYWEPLTRAPTTQTSSDRYKRSPVLKAVTMLFFSVLQLSFSFICCFFSLFFSSSCRLYVPARIMCSILQLQLLSHLDLQVFFPPPQSLNYSFSSKRLDLYLVQLVFWFQLIFRNLPNLTKLELRRLLTSGEAVSDSHFFTVIDATPHSQKYTVISFYLDQLDSKLMRYSEYNKAEHMQQHYMLDIPHCTPLAQNYNLAAMT